jgi:hypothetical protein
MFLALYAGILHLLLRSKCKGCSEHAKPGIQEFSLASCDQTQTRSILPPGTHSEPKQGASINDMVCRLTTSRPRPAVYLLAAAGGDRCRDDGKDVEPTGRIYVRPRSKKGGLAV